MSSQLRDQSITCILLGSLYGLCSVYTLGAFARIFSTAGCNSFFTLQKLVHALVMVAAAGERPIAPS